MSKRERETGPLENKIKRKKIYDLMNAPFMGDAITDSDISNAYKMNVLPIDNSPETKRDFIENLQERGESRDVVPIIQQEQDFFKERANDDVIQEKKKGAENDLDSFEMKGIEDETTVEPFGGKRRMTRRKNHRKSHKKSHRKSHRKNYKKSHRKGNRKNHSRR